MRKMYITIYTKEQGKQAYTKQQWKNGITGGRAFHRLDGPAVYFSSGYQEWWIDTTRYTEEEFKAIINKYESLPKSIKQTHELEWVRTL